MPIITEASRLVVKNGSSMQELLAAYFFWGPKTPHYLELVIEDQIRVFLVLNALSHWNRSHDEHSFYGHIDKVEVLRDETDRGMKLENWFRQNRAQKGVYNTHSRTGYIQAGAIEW